MGRRSTWTFLQRRHTDGQQAHEKMLHIANLGKCKWKLQWSITSPWSEWPSSKSRQIINAGEGVKKKEPSCTVGGNVNWCSHYGDQYGGSSKKLKEELPYDPAIPLLGIYLEKTIIHKDTCTPMFIAALFTIAKTWKQPKCPSTEEWIKMCTYVQLNITQPLKRMK